jgi:hypothetical protein
LLLCYLSYVSYFFRPSLSFWQKLQGFYVFKG